MSVPTDAAATARGGRPVPAVPTRGPGRAQTVRDAGATLAELVVVVALSSLVLLSATAVVLPMTVNAAAVQRRAVAVSEAGVAARLVRDLDRQVRSATAVQYVGPQQLRLCTFLSPQHTSRAPVTWTTDPAQGLVTASATGAPAAQTRTYPRSAVTFPAGSPAYSAGGLVRASVVATSGSGTTTTVVVTRPRAVSSGTCS